ncbi:MAG: STAS domain-containing protein [bacterium]|nr:STAS domain-containing protein [bacterium]
MSIWHEEIADCFVIHLGGNELAEDLIDQVRQVLTVAFLNRHYKIIFDLNGCSMIDSFFIGLIIQTYRELRELGGNLRCVGPNRHIRHAFEVIRLNQVVDICDTIDEAVEAFNEEEIKMRPRASA